MTPSPYARDVTSEALRFRPRLGSARINAATVQHALRPETWSRIRFVIDVVVLYLASSAALFGSPVREVAASRWLALLFPVLVVGILHARRGPDERLQASRVETGGYILGITSLAAMVTIALGTLIHGPHPVVMTVRLWLFGFVYLSLARVALVSVRRQLKRSDAFATPTLILGAGVVGGQLVKRLLEDTGYGLKPVGYLDGDPLPAPTELDETMIPILGGPDQLAHAAEATGARHVILAFSSEPDHVLVERVRDCERLGLEVSLVPRLYESISRRAALDHVGALPLLSLRSVNPYGREFAVKHALDRVLAALILLALAPLMLMIAVAVKLSSPGPILFRQRRVGRDGREFKLLKFRTMRVPERDAEFTLLAGCAPGGIEGVDRRTRIGRFLRDSSLDELPQFLNVLRGEMSIVGPRPERPEFVERFSNEVNRYDDRHRVKSGITGWAQIHGLRGQTSIADRVEWDNYYIKNWSLRLDFEILARTVSEIFRRAPNR